MGGILIWESDAPPHLNGEEFKEGFEESKVYQVLLDGQQCSSPFYMLIVGVISMYYKEDENELSTRQTKNY